MPFASVNQKIRTPEATDWAVGGDEFGALLPHLPLSQKWASEDSEGDP